MVGHPKLETDLVADKRSIELPQGGTLDVEMTPQFIAKLRQHYGLYGDQPLDDDHVRMYVWGSLNSAVVKAEQETKDVGLTGDVKGVRRTRRRKKGQGG